MGQAHQKLKERFKRNNYLEHTAAILGWDEEVNMPAGGGEKRAETLADIKLMMKENLNHQDMETWFSKAQEEVSEGGFEEKAELREMENYWKTATALPDDFLVKITIKKKQSEQAWRRYRKENNWNDFLPHFSEMLELAKEEAQIRAGADEDPYDAMINLYDPGMTSRQIERNFESLKNKLPSLLNKIISHQESWEAKPKMNISTERQREMCLEMMGILGFDFQHGRLDTAVHPFCGGVPTDVRITTRYDESDFTQSLLSAIHETGHASYEQGLPKSYSSTPLGRARGMGIHESQSLFFENIVAHHPVFVESVFPKMKTILGLENWDEQDYLRKINRVQKSLIRVDADEVSYPLHIIMRFEMERDIFAGKVTAKDLPDLWNSKMKEYFDLDTEGNFKDGIMQDVHWPAGYFGYFPSYALGSMIAAQCAVALKKEIPGWEEELRKSDMTTIRNWLGQNIWSKGSLYEMDDLLLQATGEKLNSEHLLNHFEQRYLA